MAQESLTARGTSRADAKADHSEPTLCFRHRGRSTDKSYSRDNRLVSPESSYRRRCSAPRCRLILSWGWRRSQGFGCSPIKKIRELGSDRFGVVIYNNLLLFIMTSKPSESISEIRHNPFLNIFCKKYSSFFVLIKNKNPSLSILETILESIV